MLKLFSATNNNELDIRGDANGFARLAELILKEGIHSLINSDDPAPYEHSVTFFQVIFEDREKASFLVDAELVKLIGKKEHLEIISEYFISFGKEARVGYNVHFEAYDKEHPFLSMDMAQTILSKE